MDAIAERMFVQLSGMGDQGLTAGGAGVSNDENQPPKFVHERLGMWTRLVSRPKNRRSAACQGCFRPSSRWRHRSTADARRCSGRRPSIPAPAWPSGGSCRRIPAAWSSRSGETVNIAGSALTPSNMSITEWEVAQRGGDVLAVLHGVLPVRCTHDVPIPFGDPPRLGRTASAVDASY